MARRRFPDNFRKTTTRDPKSRNGRLKWSVTGTPRPPSSPEWKEVMLNVTLPIETATSVTTRWGGRASAPAETRTFRNPATEFWDLPYTETRTNGGVR